MSLTRACYVRCDKCGSPAEISTNGAREAKEFAARIGFVRRNGEDLCIVCLRGQGEK